MLANEVTSTNTPLLIGSDIRYYSATLPSGYNKVSVIARNYKPDEPVDINLNGNAVVKAWTRPFARCDETTIATTSFNPGDTLLVNNRENRGQSVSDIYIKLEEEPRDFVDCITCPAGYFLSSDDGTCVSCMVNTYNPEPRGVICIACPVNTRALAASSALTDCKCKGEEFGVSGLTGPDGGPCHACASGYYKSVIGSWSCDKEIDPRNNTAMSFQHAINTPLRHILARGFRGNWRIGDQVRIYRNGRPRVNDVMLTYSNETGTGSWSPSNINPLLRLDNTFRFDVHTNILMQINVAESGFTLRPGA